MQHYRTKMAALAESAVRCLRFGLQSGRCRALPVPSRKVVARLVVLIRSVGEPLNHQEDA